MKKTYPFLKSMCLNHDLDLFSRLDQKHYSRLTEHRSDEHPYTKASSNLGGMFF